MRLTQEEMLAIASTFLKWRASGEAELYLFGSRTDSSKRGGDIDLLILFSDPSDLVAFKRLEFIVDLKKTLGERRIDVTLATQSQIHNDDFLKSVMESAIRLVG
jgi:predicted nucleotidyltransferase